MKIKKIDTNNKVIYVDVPLTETSGKTRVKCRENYNEYGVPIAPRQIKLNKNCYIEWQIGYDAEINDEKKMALTTIKNVYFTGANGKKKTLYELSEYLYYFHKWGVVSKERLITLKEYLENLNSSDYIDANKNSAILRENLVENVVNGISFKTTQVKYPMYIYNFETENEMLLEIKITEKQRAIGVQPMLYFCFPISKLKCEEEIFGRCAKIKEFGNLIINSKNIDVFLEMLKIFGTLSKSHNHDTLEIIDKILNN